MLHEFLWHPLPRWTNKKACPHLSDRTDCASNSDNALGRLAMLRASQRRILEATDTPAINPIVPLARSDLKRSIAQSKSIELPSSHAAATAS
jgi:hypothetical protein